jgi:hypothetical protein
MNDPKRVGTFYGITQKGCVRFLFGQALSPVRPCHVGLSSNMSIQRRRRGWLGAQRRHQAEQETDHEPAISEADDHQAETVKGRAFPILMAANNLLPE